MSDANAKIQLKVGEIEITLEGSPEYVQKQYKKMEKELGLQDRIKKSTSQTTTKKTTAETSGRKSKTTKSTSKKAPTKEFGEWLKILPKGLKKRDYALVAAYFNQSKSKKETFRTRDVSSVLKAHGIKVANPSIMVQNLAKKGEVIKEVQQQGRQKQFQFTKKGENEMRGLLSVKEK